MGVLCVCGRLGGANDSDAHAQINFTTFNPNKIKNCGRIFPPFNLIFYLRGIWGVAPNGVNTCYLFTCISIDK